MEVLKSIILSEMTNLLFEADKRNILQKFGFDEKLQNAFHEMDSKTSPWFASIVTFQYAKENGIKGNNIAELVKQIDPEDLLIFVRQKRPVLNYIKDFIKSPRRPQNLDIKRYKDLDAAHAASDEFHREIQKAATGHIQDETGEVLKTYPDYYWIDLKCNTSSAEANAMGHCGTDTSATTLFSLRDIHTKEPHVTVAVNEKTGHVTQVKGKGNKRPVDKYMSYVHDLFKEYFSNGKLRGFGWSYGQDLNIEDVKQIFPDKFDFMQVVMDSPSFARATSFNDNDLVDYLKEFIDYSNINLSNYFKIKERVKRIIPRTDEYGQRLIELHNKLVKENVVADKENFLVAILMLELPKKFVFQDVLAQFNVSMDKFKEIVREAPPDHIDALMNGMETGFVYVLTSGRNLSAQEVYNIITKMNKFEDRPEYRERIYEMIGDKINILKGTEYAQRLATEIPNITQEFPLAKNVIPSNNVSEVVSSEMDEAGSLFSDFLKRNSQSKQTPQRRVSKNDVSKFEPEKSTPDQFDKYNRFANKVTGVNLDNKRKQTIQALDQKQPEFFAMLKKNLQGYDVKPKERNVYLENRTYDYSVTFKKYPLIVEHFISIVPRNGYYNIKYHNKVSVDTTTYDETMINNLMKYKSPTTDIKKEGNFLIYKLPFQNTSLTDHAPFQDVKQLTGEIGLAFINKIKVFNSEILKSFKKAY